MKYFQKGQSLVELILAIGLSAILLPALLTGFLASREGKAQHAQRTQAVSLLKTTVEAVRSVREKGWNSFATNGAFHPEVSGSSWTLVAGEYEDPLTGFKRRVDISDVNREDGAIITSGGTLDPSTKKVVVKVSWGTPYPSSINSTLYMTRYLGNNSFLQTTKADFDVGTKSGTTVTNTSGGEVKLGAGGQGDWCSPTLSIAALDLPKSGVANALTAIEGSAFAGTGDNASGVSFAKVNVGNNPPSPSIEATFDGYKTNAVFGETAYAYLGTDNNSEEVVIINLNNIVSGKYQKVGFFNAPGNRQGKSVYVVGNTGYMTTDNRKLYSFDLSPASGGKSGSRPLLDPDGITLVGVGTKVVVVGNYAYLAIKEGSHYELQIVNVSNPNILTLAGLTDVAPTQGGEEAHDVFMNEDGTRAYLVINTESTIREFFIIDTTTKTGNPPVIGRYEANGMNPKSVTVVSNEKKAIVVGTGGEEYQVIDITTETAPVRCGGLNIDVGVNGVASVLEQDGDAYSYIITGDASSEFKIIAGGAGGGAYIASGTFESNTFDAGSQAAFNRFDASVNRPSSTDIEFQVAVKQAISESCTGVTFSGADFVGPSGTSADKFQTTVALGTETFSYVIPPIINPGQCFRYKVYLSTTDFISTPIFYDITVNYSP